MAELTPTEVDPPNSLSKQLLNVIWTRGIIETPSFVGLGVSKYRRELSEYRPSVVTVDLPDHQPADQHDQGRERQLSAHVKPPTTSTSEHHVYSPRPVFTRAGTTTALHGTEVYFSVSTYGYDCPSPNLDNPTRLPHYVWKYNCVEEKCSVINSDYLDVHDFGLAVVNEQLVVVGGETDERSTTSGRQISARDDDDEYGKVHKKVSSDIVMFDLNKAYYGSVWWYGHFPPMSKPRKQPAAIGMKQYLVVAGGQLHGEPLRLVEVLNAKSKVWSQVRSLPEPVRSLTAAICGNQLYFLGGIGRSGSTRSVFTCPVESVKKVCHSSRKKLEWQKACDTPLFRSSCLVYNDELFAFGGRTSTYRPSSNIYHYDSSLDSWKLVDQQLPTPRSMCIALTIKSKLVVIGGLVQDDEPADIIEIGTCISDPTMIMKNLLICLEAVENWKTLGLQLDISNDELIRIEGANQSNPDRCRESMLSHWLCKKKNPSWMTLASALEDMGLSIPANKIKAKYLQPTTEEPVTKKSTIALLGESLLHKLLRRKPSHAVDVDAAPRASQSTTKPQAARKPSPAVASRPTINELISMKKRDGSKGSLKIIHWITSHEPAQCEDFAHKLLADRPTVRKLRRKHQDQDDFIRAVLQKWLDRDDDDDDEESLPCTWEALVTCSRDASLEGEFVRLLRDNIPK